MSHRIINASVTIKRHCEVFEKQSHSTTEIAFRFAKCARNDESAEQLRASPQNFVLTRLPFRSKVVKRGIDHKR